MNNEFCEKTIECIDALNKRSKLLEEASKLQKQMISELNKKINILDEQLTRVSKSNKVDYKED